MLLIFICFKGTVHWQVELEKRQTGISEMRCAVLPVHLLSRCQWFGRKRGGAEMRIPTAVHVQHTASMSPLLPQQRLSAHSGARTACPAGDATRQSRLAATSSLGTTTDG